MCVHTAQRKIERTNEQMNGITKTDTRINALVDWLIYGTQWMKEQKMNRWMDKWMNGQLNQSINQWMNVRMTEQVNDWMGEGINESMNEQRNEQSSATHPSTPAFSKWPLRDPVTKAVESVDITIGGKSEIQWHLQRKIRGGRRKSDQRPDGPRHGRSAEAECCSAVLRAFGRRNSDQRPDLIRWGLKPALASGGCIIRRCEWYARIKRRNDLKPGLPSTHCTRLERASHGP